MSFFAERVSFIRRSGKIAVKIVCGGKYAHHIANVEITEYGHGQAYDIHFEPAEFYKVFNAEHNYGKQNEIVYPHGVMLHYNCVGAKGVHS